MSSPSSLPSVGSPPALVLGDGVGALGALRSLGREGIDAYYVSYARDVASFSRYSKPLVSQLGPFSTRVELEAFLEKLPFERMVIIPCSDWWVRAVAELSPALRERFPSSVADRSTLEILADKAEFARFAQAHDLPHPSTVCIEREEDFDALPDSAFASSFLKPRDSQSFSEVFGCKAVAVSSRAHAKETFRRAHAAGQRVVLQEYVPGPASGHYYVDAFVDRNGRVLSHFARQRLRMHHAFANSSALWSIPHEEAHGAPQIIDRAIAALRPRGIVSAEFKLDTRDNQLKIIEINARVWKHVDFASQCGVNIARLAYDDALGRGRAPIDDYVSHVRCIDVHRDLPHCIKLVRSRELGLPEWARTWWNAREPVLSLEDPVPGFVHARNVLAEVMRRRILRASP